MSVFLGCSPLLAFALAMAFIQLSIQIHTQSDEVKVNQHFVH